MAQMTAGPAAPYRANPQRSLELALAAAKAAAENRGQDIVVLDTTELTALFDYFVIATGTSSRQLRAICQHIEHTLKHDLGDRRMGIAGYEESRWIVLDYGSVVVHLFDAETRAYYGLEDLWAESQRVDLSEILSDVA